MAMFLFVTNNETGTDPDTGVAYERPAIPVGTSYVGNQYTRNNGNQTKWLIKTPVDLTGLPGVFGPITPEDVQAAIDADGGQITKWDVDEMPSWALDGDQGGWVGDGT